ncbi:hypothetical protein [Arthrobacter sp. HLT1-20]
MTPLRLLARVLGLLLRGGLAILSPLGLGRILGLRGLAILSPLGLGRILGLRGLAILSPLGLGRGWSLLAVLGLGGLLPRLGRGLSGRSRGSRIVAGPSVLPVTLWLHRRLLRFVRHCAP